VDTLSLENPRRTWLDWVAPGLVVAYLTMSRSFAHWGVGPLYIGELAMGAILLAKPQALLGMWYDSALRRSPLSWFVLCLTGSAAYGLLQLLRGMAAGHDMMTALQCLVFYVYPFFFLVGAWVGARHPRLLPKLILVLAWIHGIYGVLYLLVFSPLGLGDSAIDAEAGYVGWFGQPYGAGVVVLGLLSFQPNLVRVWLPLLLNVFVLLVMKVRASWLGCALAAPLWAVLSGKINKFMNMAAVVFFLLLVGLITDLELPSEATRDEPISARVLIGRAIATFDSRWADEFVTDLDFHAGTVSWRTDWWRAIARRTHESPTSAFLGMGLGYPIWDLHPLELADDKLRTPHNVFVFVLGYTGWIGLLLFGGLLLSLFGVLWRAYKQTGNAFGVCYLIMIVAWAFFDNFFETPFGAIPFFLLTGMAAAPVLRPRQEDETL
jgi:hypothetical protein